MMAQELRDQLSRLLSGQASLEDFEDWFLPTTWDLSVDEDPDAYYLAGEVRLCLAEYDRGDRTEHEVEVILYEIYSRTDLNVSTSITETEDIIPQLAVAPRELSPA
jgi:hypothetical protein